MAVTTAHRYNDEQAATIKYILKLHGGTDEWRALTAALFESWLDIDAGNDTEAAAVWTDLADRAIADNSLVVGTTREDLFDYIGTIATVVID